MKPKGQQIHSPTLPFGWQCRGPGQGEEEQGRRGERCQVPLLRELPICLSPHRMWYLALLELNALHPLQNPGP